MRYNYQKILFIFIIIASHFAFGQIPVSINSGNPAFPFPQFLDYGPDRLTLASHNPEGVTHAEMEQRIRDAWQIYANSFSYTGETYAGVKYIKGNVGCPYDCAEGDGYALLGAAYLGDKSTFDGLWFRTHDVRRATKKLYSNCNTTLGPGYQYGDNTLLDSGSDAATDGSFDVAMALLMAWKQWGDNSGYNDDCGNPISYKKEALEVIRGLVEVTDRFKQTGDCRRLSGSIGIDGYFKSGNTYGELSNWATGQAICPEFTGPTQLYADYMAPSYAHVFSDFLLKQGGLAEDINWNIPQFKKAEASSDWLMGKLLLTPAIIPFAGALSLTDTTPVFKNFNDGEDFRLGWRTIQNYMWHGNQTLGWNPTTHSVTNKPNSYEKDLAIRFASFLKSPQSSPWNNSCENTGSSIPLTFNGPSTLKNYYSLEGKALSQFTTNWIHGTGSPAAVSSQDFDLMAKMFRQCVLEWDVNKPGDNYITSQPRYFDGWFRLLGMLTLTGNNHSPLNMVPKANLKVYLAVDKTVAYKGDVVKYTVNYRNYGSVTATGTQISIVVPTGSEIAFLSAGGVSSGNTIVWNIGTVTGFTSLNSVAATQGQVSFSIKVSPAMTGKICNAVSIQCNNGTGWTSNEYPNNQTAVMERNCFDIISSNISIVKYSDKQEYSSGQTANFKIKFENRASAKLTGGRSGVNFSFANSNSSPATYNLKYRLFHDADEAYIDYGNYRFSYYVFDSLYNCNLGMGGCTKGWNLTNTVAEGFLSSNVQFQVEPISKGSDMSGKWNQRHIIKLPAQHAATTQHLFKYYGLPSRVHQGTLNNLRGIWMINRSDYSYHNWNADWSGDPNMADSDGGLYFPISDDLTDPINSPKPVTKWHKSSCETATKTAKKILVEEWDGYTWRSVFGDAPIAAKDLDNVILTDTLPAGFTFKSFVNSNQLGVIPTITSTTGGRTLIKWSVPKFPGIIKDSIVYTATANSNCPSNSSQLLSTSSFYLDGVQAEKSSIGVSLNCTITSIEENTESLSIDVFPNPAKDFIHISGLKNDVTSRLVLKDMKGVIVLEKSENLHKDFDISKIENGAYLIEISSGQSTKRVKLIVQK